MRVTHENGTVEEFSNIINGEIKVVVDRTDEIEILNLTRNGYINYGKIYVYDQQNLYITGTSGVYYFCEDGTWYDNSELGYQGAMSNYKFKALRDEFGYCYITPIWSSGKDYVVEINNVYAASGNTVVKVTHEDGSVEEINYFYHKKVVLGLSYNDEIEILNLDRSGYTNTGTVGGYSGQNFYITETSGTYQYYHEIEGGWRPSTDLGYPGAVSCNKFKGLRDSYGTCYIEVLWTAN